MEPDRIDRTVRDLAGAWLKGGGRLRVRVTTGSMYPFVRTGESLLVEAAAAGDLAPGDILVFSNKPWVAHRIVAPGTRAGSWVTKGDAAPTCDKIEAEEWLGRAAFVVTPTSLLELARARRAARLIAHFSFLAASDYAASRSVQAHFWRLVTRLAARSLRRNLAHTRGMHGSSVAGRDFE